MPLQVDLIIIYKTMISITFSGIEHQ